METLEQQFDSRTGVLYGRPDQRASQFLREAPSPLVAVRSSGA